MRENTANTFCESGYLDLDLSRLRPKEGVEFGLPAKLSTRPPDIKDMRVSIVYSMAEAGHLAIFNATLRTVIRHFPGALEIVVVVGTEDMKLAYENVLAAADFDPHVDVRVVSARDETSRQWSSESVDSSGDGRTALKRFPLLWADKFSSGNHVLHLDRNSVLLKNVTYDRVFHFGKPVIPFERFRDDDGELEGGQSEHVQCREYITAILTLGL